MVAPVTTRNPAGIALLVGGAIAILVGAILWIVGANQLKQDTLVGGYTRALGLDNGLNLDANTPAMAADQAMIWWGIALVILGVLLVVARLVIAAARR